MISHHHRTVFVHIPKCGGQSVETAFLTDIGLDWETRAPLLLRRNDNPRLGPPLLGHLTAQEYMTFRYLPEAMFDAYFTFAVVRDPYARAVSLFNYMRFTRGLVPFCTKYLPRVFELAEEYATPGHRYRGNYHFVRPQADYVLDADGRIMVDEVVKLEEIATRFDTIRARSGLRADLPHVNHTTDKKARPSDLTDEARAALRRLYAADFETFGYAP